MTTCQNPGCDAPASSKRGGRCNACFQYRWRRGIERPAYLVNALLPPPRCATPGCERARRGWKGDQPYCAACYYYRWRTGRERPLPLCRRQMVRREPCARCGGRKFTAWSECWNCRKNQFRRSRSKVA